MSLEPTELPVAALSAGPVVLVVCATMTPGPTWRFFPFQFGECAVLGSGLEYVDEGEHPQIGQEEFEGM